MASLLALRLQGLAGVLLTDARGIGRHALTLALGLGVPVVVGVERAQGEVVALGGTVGVVVPWPLRVPPGGRFVVALGAARGGATVELVGGQPEELALAREAIDRGDVGEIGLLRLEHLVLADPGMDAVDLVGRLTAIFGALQDVPVAVRAATWAPDKPRPETFRLSALDQTRAIEQAAGAVNHAGVTVVVRSGDAPPCALPWAPFIESTAASPDPTRPVWIGLGDLSSAAGSAAALQTTVDTLAASSGPAYLCGVPADWTNLLAGADARLDGGASVDVPDLV